jgi:hypothetical protein
VTFTDLDVRGINEIHQQLTVPATVEINDSTVQLLNARITGHHGGHEFWLYGYRGGDALTITNSAVLMTHPEVSGGQGQAAIDQGGSYCGYAGAGGDGVVVSCGQIIITGDDMDFVAGGDGGAGVHPPTATCCADGAPGGTGVVVQCEGVFVSGPVVLRGGSGGACNACNPCGPGSNGAPFSGTVHFLPTPYPVLDTTGDLHPAVCAASPCEASRTRV